MAPRRNRHTVVAVFLLLCVSSAGFLSVPAAGEETGSAMHFRLFHRSELGLFHPRSGENNGYDAALGYMRDVAWRDLLRRERMIEMVVASRRRAAELDVDSGGKGSFAAPISAGAYVGTGEYFVKIQLGTPAKEVVLVADTGSELTWTRCSYAGPLPSRRRPPPFRPFDSTSFVKIPCSSATCKSPLPFSLATCPSPSSPCLYDFRYLDGSFSRGIYANETVTVSGRNGRVSSQIQNVIIGCSNESDGIAFNRTDGVLGLGQSASSFTVKAAQIYGGKFSYCLVDHLSPRDVGNYLIFGENPRVSTYPGGFRKTPLVLDAAIQPFYGVIVKGISIAHRMLPIPDASWTFRFSGGTVSAGVIIDSGMTLTSLVRPAYDEVMAAFEGHYRDFRTFESPPFRLCFNTTELAGSSRRGRKRQVGPTMAIHLAGGARFSPHVDSYVVPVADGIRCIGILPVVDSSGISVIGNIFQQRYLWEFDLLHATLGFARSSCTN